MIKSYDKILIPYSWYNDLTSDLSMEEPNEELGKERLWYLYISDRNGEQVMSGNPAIDYAVQSLLGQLNRMRPEYEDKQMRIAKMRSEGYTSAEIGEELNMSAGAVRKTNGWRDFVKICENVPNVRVRRENVKNFTEIEEKREIFTF